MVPGLYIVKGNAANMCSKNNRWQYVRHMGLHRIYELNTTYACFLCSESMKTVHVLSSFKKLDFKCANVDGESIAIVKLSLDTTIDGSDTDFTIFDNETFMMSFRYIWIPSRFKIYL